MDRRISHLTAVEGPVIFIFEAGDIFRNYACTFFLSPSLGPFEAKFNAFNSWLLTRCEKSSGHDSSPSLFCCEAEGGVLWSPLSAYHISCVVLMHQADGTKTLS
jgi:hypothetical protein